jgi:hypothetical protein
MGHDHFRRYDDGSSVMRLLPGIVLVSIGALFLLDNLHILIFQEWVNYWPVIVIVIGIVKLVDSTRQEGRIAGGILTGVGTVLLAERLGYLYMSWGAVWPLFLIGIGIFLLFHRLSARPSDPAPSGGGPAWSSGPGLNEVAIFGGGKRQINSPDFQGGQITAIFGGVDLDLREAGIAADSAVIEVNALFGGASIRIPDNWSTVVQGMGIFGGFDDKTLHPDPRAPGTKHLIVKGAAVFGGVAVRN